MLRVTKAELSVPLPIRLVLDTNVILDWLVFRDTALEVLSRSLRSETAILVSHDPAVAELARVLAYPKLDLDVAQQADILAEYRRISVRVAFGRELPAGFPRCRDADDQHFLELACRTDAVLVSRDKAVLALRSKARRLGVSVVDIPTLISTLTQLIDARTPVAGAYGSTP